MTHSNHDSEPIAVSSILAALSHGLDLSEGQPMGHSERTCVLGMRLAQELGFDEDDQATLYYALLMKNLGCSSNASRLFQIMGSDDIAARRDVKLTDWTRLTRDSVEYALAHIRPQAPFVERVQTFVAMASQQTRNTSDLVKIRAERGAALARRLGFSDEVAEAIHGLDELWNGEGHPNGFRGQDIPRAARIANLAQTVEIFERTRGRKAALEMARHRSGDWFDPQMVLAFESLARREEIWSEMQQASALVAQLEPVDSATLLSDDRLETICLVFADVIDAKSPFTYRHSLGVAGAAQAIATSLNLPETTRTLLRRAGLLHDIGKLAVSNTILDKPAKLDEAEWKVVREHPRLSYEILRRIPGFGPLADLASTHHEKLDGSGYWRGLDATQLSLEARILVVADIYDALAARRPYRDALPKENVLAIMARETPRAIDAQCFYALSGAYQQAESMSESLAQLMQNVGRRHPIPLPEAASDSEAEAAAVVSISSGRRRKRAAYGR